MRRLLLWCASGVLALLAIGYGVLVHVAASRSEVRSVVVDHSYRYRVRADYLYHGQPLRFDIVVGCAVAVTDYTVGGRTVDTALAPMFFGQRMPDNKMVMMAVPQACGGETTDNPDPGHRYGAAMAPFMVVYDNADKPLHGWGYATDDAYESPLSELAFKGATITTATQGEFEAWRRDVAPHNAVTPAMLEWSWGPKGIVDRYVQLGEWRLGDRCWGVVRLEAPPALQAVLHPFWQGWHTRYWAPSDAQAVPTEWPTKRGPYDGHNAFDYTPTWQFGIVRRQPAVLPESAGLWMRVPGAVYPMRSNFSYNTLSVDPVMPARLVEGDVDLSPARRGFVACDTYSPVYETATVGAGWHVRMNPPGPVRHLEVNGVPVLTHELPGQTILNNVFFYEADRTVFMPVTLDLVDMRGTL